LGGVKGDYYEKEKFRILLNKVRRSLFNNYMIQDELFSNSTILPKISISIYPPHKKSHLIG